MANTERVNTLQKVVAARKAVSEARTRSGLTPGQQNLLDTAYSRLIDAEETLIIEDLKQSVGALKETATELAKIARRMKQSIEKLKEIAELISAAARALGALGDIVAKAVGAGIL